MYVEFVLNLGLIMGEELSLHRLKLRVVLPHGQSV